MAQLTATIDTQSRGKSVMDGPKVAPSFLQGLAGFASDFLQGAPQRATQAAAAAKAKQEASLDELTGAMTGELTRTKDTLKTLQTGVNQGKVPQATYDLQLEKVYTDWAAKHPEARAEGWKFLNDNGFNHWMYQDIQQQFDSQKQMATAAVKLEEDAIQYAQSHGAYVEGATREQNITAGRNLMRTDTQIADLRTASTEARAAAAEGRASATFDETQNNKQIAGAVNANINTVVNQWIPTLHTLVSGAVGDVEKQKRLNESIPQIGLMIEAQRRTALTKLGDTADATLIAQVNKQFDDVKASMDNLFTGTLSDYQNNKRALDGLQTQFGVSSAESFPIYSRMVSMMGREAVNNIFQGDLSTVFSKETLKAVTDELKGYDTKDAERGRVHLMRAAQLLRGETGIQQLSEKEAMEQMPMLAGAALATQNAVARGSKDPGTLTTWANTYSNVITAVTEIQPGQRNMSSLWAGSRIAFAPAARTAIEAMMVNPEKKEQGTIIAQGSRSAAQTALITASHAQKNYNQFQSEYWDASTNQFKVKFDQRAYDRWAARQPKGPGGPGTLSAVSRFGEVGRASNVPSAIEMMTLTKTDRDAISTRNAAITHLVETAQYDETVPKGVTKKQLYDHYARGTPLVSVNGKPMLTTDQEFDQAMDKFDAGIKSSVMSGSEATRQTVPISNIQFSNDFDAAARTLILEASNQPTAGKYAVASTMFNRLDSGKYGDTMRDVVLAKNQYEPWSTRVREGLEIDPDSKQYQEALQIVQDVAAGKGRVPYTNFLNKEIVTQRGDRIPDWASGQGTQIGQHTFY